MLVASPVVVLRWAVAAPAPAAHGAVDDDACCKNIIHNIQNAVVCLMIIIMSHVACYGHLSELFGCVVLVVLCLFLPKRISQMYYKVLKCYSWILTLISGWGSHTLFARWQTIQLNVGLCIDGSSGSSLQPFHVIAKRYGRIGTYVYVVLG